jgi:hypothetical protein
MSAFYSFPRALFGAPLLGDKLVRSIYTDESGTSGKSKIVLVAALIVDTDRQWKQAALKLYGALQPIPPQYSKRFVYHTTKMLNPDRYPGWDLNERIRIVHEIMAIPKVLKIPIIFGACKKGLYNGPPALDDLSVQQSEHAMTFGMAMSYADTFIGHFYPDELATLVAEDTDEMHKTLSDVLNSMRLRPMIVRTDDGQARSCVVSHIVDEVHFIDKKTVNAPLLQIVDAIAWGLHRYFEKGKYGDKCLQSIAGNLTLKDFAHMDLGGIISEELVTPYDDFSSHVGASD